MDGFQGLGFRGALMISLNACKRFFDRARFVGADGRYNGSLEGLRLWVSNIKPQYSGLSVDELSLIIKARIEQVLDGNWEGNNVAVYVNCQIYNQVITYILIGFGKRV